ncbi:MAG: hypothetical protein R3B96_09615 [Pirellulaceae bacterium]
MDPASQTASTESLASDSESRVAVESSSSAENRFGQLGYSWFRQSVALLWGLSQVVVLSVLPWGLVWAFNPGSGSAESVLATTGFFRFDQAMGELAKASIEGLSTYMIAESFAWSFVLSVSFFLIRWSAANQHRCWNTRATAIAVAVLVPTWAWIVVGSVQGTMPWLAQTRPLFEIFITVALLLMTSAWAYSLVHRRLASATNDRSRKGFSQGASSGGMVAVLTLVVVVAAFGWLLFRYDVPVAGAADLALP